MASTTISDQIYLSRDQIVNQITEFAKQYLELENIVLTKSSFLSFVINTLSTLTSNLLFYETSVYREFFLTTAQLPESVLNLSAFLGYNTREAEYSTVNVLMTVPFGFEDATAQFTVPEAFKFYGGDITFQTYYRADVTVYNNSYVTVQVTEGNKVYSLPVVVDSTAATPSFSFVLPLRQYKKTIQEFQIDSDLQRYQFTTIDVPLTGKVSEMSVEVQDPDGTSWTLYSEYQSLYLMTSTDYGYVSRRTSFGRRVYFGNGLIGFQPLPGSTVKVTVYETEGADGNVIAGSIVSGDRIYTVTLAGYTRILNYSVVNTSDAFGGEDEESIEEIRSNAIANLTALGRLVSETDYKAANVVIEDSPLAGASVPVLKRSDVKVNEIQLFTSILFGTDIVPTRNVVLETDPSVVYIPRDTIIIDNGEQYYTVFDMTVDSINKSVNYHYIMYEIELIPTLVTSYGSTYNLYATQVLMAKSGDVANIELSYTSDELDYSLCDCELTILETGQTFTMTNDSGAKKFTYTFDPYTIIQSGELTYYFTLSHLGTPFGRYYTKFTFRRALKDFMMSNMEIDSTSLIIYDIPSVKKTYYDSINQRDFETQVLQKIVETMTFYKYRMITDFTNLKFVNAYGSMTNMQHNTVTKLPVLDIQCNPPLAGTSGDRYIVANDPVPGSDWDGYSNKYATIVDEMAMTWEFEDPSSNDIVYVSNQDKKYIFNGSKWLDPVYQIPLLIEAEVFKTSSYSGTDVQLANTVKSVIYSVFSQFFGANVPLYRSEIISVIQSIDGVSYCNLIKPASDIFFNFDLDTFTQDQLLRYGPEYLYFTEDNISIRAI
jgi:hypothetical protein